MPSEECGGEHVWMWDLTKLLDYKPLAAACLFALLASCAKPVTQPATSVAEPVTSDREALDQLRTGKAALDCSPACAPKWYGNLAELQTHYNAAEWRDLALLVIRTNYGQDLAYFYLGRAAEGLGARSSALTYYGTARALSTGADNSVKCIATQQGCNGLSLLTETSTRIQVVEEVRRGTRRPVHASGQQAPDSWVDPEPASQ